MKQSNIIMKKFILIVLALLTFSCSPKKNVEEYEYLLTYRVYYPGNTVEKEMTFCSSKECRYVLSSYKGSNHLTIYEGQDFSSKVLSSVLSTTAPIEVVYFNKTK